MFYQGALSSTSRPKIVRPLVEECEDVGGIEPQMPSDSDKGDLPATHPVVDGLWRNAEQLCDIAERYEIHGMDVCGHEFLPINASWWD